MREEALQLLSPLVLVPLLVWIGYRYLPLLSGAGRLRVYLLVFLCGGAVAAQVGMIRTQLYPLVTWTMYGQVTADTRTWQFVGVGPEGEERFAWEEVSPTQSMRAYLRHFTQLATAVEIAPDDEARAERSEELARMLAPLIDLHNRRGRRPPVDAVRVERCKVDIREPRRREEVRCEELLTVRGTRRAP